MAKVSMPVGLRQRSPVEREQTSSFSSSPSTTPSVPSFGGSSQNLLEIEEEPPTPGSGTTGSSSFSRNTALSINDDGEEKLYVAVGKEFKESKSTLFWALQNNLMMKRIYLIHIHRPSPTIPMMGGRFPASRLSNQQVQFYRLQEREKVDKTLEEYKRFCRSCKFQAEQLVIESDDVAKGLVELITQFGITRLVMGAAADKNYKKKMKAPKSKTACIVQKEALSSCSIWFVCKGHLICTRDSSLDGYVTPSPMASPSTRSTQSEPLWSETLYQSGLSNPIQDLFKHRSKSHSGVLLAEETIGPLPQVEAVRTSTRLDSLNLEESPIDNWEGVPRNLQASNSCSYSGGDEVAINLGSHSLPKDGESERSMMLLSVHETEEDPQIPSAQDKQEYSGVYKVYDKLEESKSEVANLKLEAYEESCRRIKAEKEALAANRRAKYLEMKCDGEMKLRKETEEKLASVKLEMEKLNIQQNEISEELQRVCEQKSELEIQVSESDLVIKDINEKLVSARDILYSLQRERDGLQQERDDALRKVEELCRAREELSSSTHRVPNFPEFSYLELERATLNFDSSRKIGEGGYGSVYKGFLYHTTVAIKMLHSDSLQGHSEFHQEVNILSRVRHPNLVTLIGACSKVWALVYEFLPNGSLEDRLSCVDNAPPLSWQVRTRISAEICSALIFLHSNQPHSVVHGDLKPANILLDANFVSKLSDFGISRLLTQSTTTTTLYCRTDPKGTFVYMDPEFTSTGLLTPQSDVYSFGIILLRLLTGRPPLGIVKVVQEALEMGTLQAILDPTAGDWPFVQAQQLAHLGIRCCEMNRKRRPDLVSEVWRVLEPMKNAALGPSVEEDSGHIPSYFLCPIFQEIMRGPHIAADGFTYEAEALKGWLESRHDTSPMTNLKLSNNQLIPNRALRSAIQEWLQHHQL